MEEGSKVILKNVYTLTQFSMRETPKVSIGFRSFTVFIYVYLYKESSLR